MFSIGDIFRFQIGDAGAMRRVLESRWSLLVGAIFVITAGIARHYDQKYLIWEWWLPQPFIIGVASCLAIFLTAWIGLRMGRPKRDDRPHFLNQYLAFLGAFLMTAPLAWLYAIPVEQWVGLETAARINIALLAVVAFWRVALMVRVLKLVTGCHWIRCLMVVLFPSAVEALFLSNALHMQLVGMMGGVQLPPHEEILAEALRVAAMGSLLVAFVTPFVIVAFAYGVKRASRSFPPARVGIPTRALIFAVAALLAWTAYAWPWQIKQYRRFVVRHHMRHDDFRSALQYFASFDRAAFPSPAQLPPDPFDPYTGSSQLIEMLKALQERHPDWLRQEYYQNAKAAIFSRDVRYRVFDAPELLQALVSTEGGRDFVGQSPQQWLDWLSQLEPENESSWLEESYHQCRKALEDAGLALSPLPEGSVDGG